MASYVWPIALIVFSNIVYQICAKAVPGDIHPLAAAALYFALNRGGSLLREYGRLNWASIVLGLVILGLEVGWIYAYKAGWPVSTAFIVQSSFLAVCLLAVGRWLYAEAIPWNRLVGALICLVGLVFINYK